ncbi:MAG: hypothetical protein KDJ52_11035 [Anaerolineae bacterium]|nr:hypothetical protein [Anaerolineae bacterium]
MTKTNRLRVFQQQIQRLERRLVLLTEVSNRLSWLRAIVFFAGLLTSGAVFYFYGPWLFAVSFIIATVLFSMAVYAHQRIEQAVTRHRAWRDIKRTHIARMQLDWPNIPLLSQRQPRFEHPFEADLDLLGERSVHQLLDTTVSLEGSQRLRTWLTDADPELTQIIRRQELVKELLPRHLFRHKVILNATAAANTAKIWNAQRLLTWLDQPTDNAWGLWIIVAGGLVIANAVLFWLNYIDLIPAIWQITLVLYFGLLFFKSSTTKELFHEALTLQDALKQLDAVFQQIERYSYRHTPYLKALCAPFLDDENQPSRHMSQINRVVVLAGLRENPFVWLLLNLVFPWDFFVAYRLDRVKMGLAQPAPHWLDAWFELDALSALANFGYLNPTYTLPEVVEIEQAQPSDAVFQVVGLGHPLLPEADRVCNAFTIDSLGDIAIITGSNMSGKSTFLRTIGVNLALAYAGGPVCADQLHTGLFRLFTSIKVSDSVTSGISYFYAEVKRLKALLDKLERDHPLPLFFFIDEIFRGTNNRERLIGSQSYVQALAARRGVGLISTHDLELVKLADEVPAISNYHFRDDVTDSRMVFDYTLRPGPCPTTNALKLMALEGLPVRGDDQ